MIIPIFTEKHLSYFWTADPLDMVDLPFFSFLRDLHTDNTLASDNTQDCPLLLDFNDNTVQTVEVQNHLGFSLDKKLDFNIHIDNKTNKYNKMIDMMKRLSLSILRDSLLTIYNLFVRPYLGYADIIYDKPGNVNFESKLEKVQYNASSTQRNFEEPICRTKVFQSSFFPYCIKIWKS